MEKGFEGSIRTYQREFINPMQDRHALYIHLHSMIATVALGVFVSWLSANLPPPPAPHIPQSIHAPQSLQVHNVPHDELESRVTQIQELKVAGLLHNSWKHGNFVSPTPSAELSLNTQEACNILPNYGISVAQLSKEYISPS